MGSEHGPARLPPLLGWVCRLPCFHDLHHVSPGHRKLVRPRAGDAPRPGRLVPREGSEVPARGQSPSLPGVSLRKIRYCLSRGELFSLQKTKNEGRSSEEELLSRCVVFGSQSNVHLTEKGHAKKVDHLWHVGSGLALRNETTPPLMQ